jgi:hypothetical protein
MVSIMNVKDFDVVFEKNDSFQNSPTHGVQEFRNNKDLAKKHFGKELIQNCLDARDKRKDEDNRNNSIKNDPVKIHFRYLSYDDLSPDARKELQRLRGVLKEAGNPPSIQSAIENEDSKPSCLIIEEEGTTGLVGDYTKERFSELRKWLLKSYRKKLNEEEAKLTEGQNYLSFTRTDGVSYKGDDNLGSRGVGKWTLNYASTLHTHLFITKRVTDDKTLLGGVTRLSRNFSKPNDDSVEYFNLGTWGIFCDDWEDKGRCPISSEFSDQNLIIEHYKKLFDINRSTYGTTFIVPFAEDGYDDARKTLYGNIESFYRPISKGELIISHSGFYDSKKRTKDKSLEPKTYDENNLRAFLESEAGEVMPHFFEFDNNHLKNIENKNYTTLKETACDNERIDENDFKEGDLEKFLDSYRQGNLVTLEVPVVIPLKSSNRKCKYYVSLQPSPQKLNSQIKKKWKRIFRDSYYLKDAMNFREPATISGVLRQFCIVEAMKGTESYKLIRASENESHQAIEEDNPELQKKYDNRKTFPILRAFTRSYASLALLVQSNQNEELNFDIGNRFMQIPDDEVKVSKGGSDNTNNTSTNDNGTTTTTPTYPKGNPNLLNVTSYSNRDGFSWSVNRSIEKHENYFEKPIRWKIWFECVDRLEKSSKSVNQLINLKNSTKFKFELNGVMEYRPRETHAIYIEADNPDFKLSLRYDLPLFMRNIITRYKQDRMK